MSIKVCRLCAVELPVEEFHKNKAMPDGLQSSCKACLREYERKRRAANALTKKDAPTVPLYAHGQTIVRTICPGCKAEIDVVLNG